MKNIVKKSILILALPSLSFAQSIPNEILQKPNTPVVSVGGFIHFNAAYRKQDSEYSDQRLPDSKLKADGTVNPQFAGTHNRFSRNYGLANDSEIYIKVGAISDAGLKYGAIVELEADTTSNGLNEGFNADKSFIFTESSIGKFEFGNNNAANQKMKVGPASFARAAGGISGKYLQHINLPMYSDNSHVDPVNVICAGNISTCTTLKLPYFIVIPQSPIAHGGYAKSFYSRLKDSEYQNEAADGNIDSNQSSFNRNSQNNPLLGYKNGSFGQLEDATKISFYTPRVNGWQAGFSFTPDTGDSGTTASISGDDSGDIKNVVSWGVNYSNNVDNLGFAFSFTGENGQFENSKIKSTAINIQRNSLASYDTGLMLTYFGFTIGGSYGYWGNSIQPKTGIYSCNYSGDKNIADQDCSGNNLKKFSRSQYYTAGLAYEFGPFAASITHLKSQFQDNKYKAVSFGVDYKLSKGLTPYFEVTQFKFNSNQPVAKDINYPQNVTYKDLQLKDNKGYVALIGLLFAF